jgi:ABC-type lipoprotein export system ATPase subunit
MVSIRDIDFRYPGNGFRLKVPSLEMAPGETVAVIGPSGTGKTTLLNLIAGVEVPGEGQIIVGDTDLATIGDADRRALRIRTIGMVFQAFELLSHLDVLDNVLLPYRIHSALHLENAVRERAVELVRELGLGEKLRRNVTRLSQGERQRVAIGRALVTDPPLLLADEPTGNLDPSNKGRILDLLFSQVKSRGATLVTVTHDHALLDRFDRVIEFSDLQGGGTSQLGEATA